MKGITLTAAAAAALLMAGAAWAQDKKPVTPSEMNY